MDIKIKYRAVDGFSQSRRFKTLKGANAFAVKWVGATPTLGSTYAVSDDGVGKIMVEGCGLSELFYGVPEKDAGPLDSAERAEVLEEEHDFEIKYRGTER